MKPMLERKRRARINRCLDELKELMSSALASEGENLTKLEKADVLELTVRHLHKLRERQALGLSATTASSVAAAAANNNNNGGNNETTDKFRAGFTHCAAEVSRYLATSTGLDVSVGQHLLSHLGRCVHQLESSSTSAPSSMSAVFPSASYTPPSSPTQQQQQHHHHHHQLMESTQHLLHLQQQQQQQQHQMRCLSLPLMPVSPVSSPALSDMGTESGPCDYSKYSIRSDLYSPSFQTSTAISAEKGGPVWRPW